MRDIEFRGKYNGASNHWVYGSLLIKEGSYFIVDKGPVQGGFYHASFSVIPETVGQYTGEIDKRGVKVYEGDIIKFYHPNECHSERIYFIVYRDCNFAIISNEGDNFWLGSKSLKNLEVIGNIYDNRELIK